MNLARSGERFYDIEDPYSEAEYDHKVDGTAGVDAAVDDPAHIPIAAV